MFKMKYLCVSELLLTMALTATFQVFAPSVYREKILNLAHDNAMSGHLGITKTYNGILRHFSWPRLKASVVEYCQTGHVCQLAGKPNQVVHPAPLQPIPVIGEPFETHCGLCRPSPQIKIWLSISL